jgi:hypothetical protein
VATDKDRLIKLEPVEKLWSHLRGALNGCQAKSFKIRIEVARWRWIAEISISTIQN